MAERIRVRDEEERSFCFMISPKEQFTLEILNNVFPGTSSLVFTESSTPDEKVVVTAINGEFRTPPGGWEKSGRQYFVIKGVEATTSRADKIKEIPSGFKSKRGATSGKKRPAEDSSKTVKHDESKSTRSTHIRLGWMHFRNGHYKQVKDKDGGMVRWIDVGNLHDVYAEDIIQLGKRVFFENKITVNGDIDEMDVIKLGNARGEEIAQFTILESTSRCSYGQYLKERGLYASRFTLFLMTEQKTTLQDEAMIDPSLLQSSEVTVTATIAEAGTVVEGNAASVVEGEVSAVTSPLQRAESVEQQTMKESTNAVLGRADEKTFQSEREKGLSLTFIRKRDSLYSGEVGFLKCHGIAECHLFVSTEDPDVALENFNPYQHDFVVSSITVGSKELVVFEPSDEEPEKLVFHFPFCDTTQEGIILHHPDEVQGYDVCLFVIGVVTKYHGEHDKTKHDWYKDDTLIQSGASCILVLSQPGVYYCEVSYDGSVEKSRSITITAASSAFAKTSGDPCIATWDVPEVAVDDLLIDKSTQLGRGSFGTVFKGIWLGPPVAIKEIPFPKRSRAQMQKVVDKEISICAKLRHPNIVQFLSYSKSSASVYLVHEYIQGSNMEDVIFDEEIKHEMAIQPADKVNIARQVLRGVAYMHAMRPMVLHQDIKPGNILIKEKSFVTKLCDFGISQIKSVVGATATFVGTSVGSPAYMAPECLIGEDKSSPFSDMWSVGITILEFFCERDAWESDEGLNPVEKIKGHMRDCSSPIRPFDDLPTEVRKWLEQCVSYNPVTRPTAMDVLEGMMKL